MIEYRNSLVATDYSEDSDLAVMHAADLAVRHGARLHILHVLGSLHRYRPEEISEGPDQVAQADEGLLAAKVEELKERCQKRLRGVEWVTCQVKAGAPFVEIVRYARDNDIDLIVMGASGHSELARTQYGSTVENVSRRAHCHVMAVRNPEKTYTL